MKSFVSPHSHGESPLTGSTLASMISKAKEMGRTHFAYTDHGHLSSALKAYRLCKGDKKAKLEHLKKDIKFIPGIEIYFKDAECPIVVGTKADRCKYFTLTLYAHDQPAYQELSKLVSRTDFPTIEIYEETQQLWAWKHLEEISKHNISIVLGGIHCIVGKANLAGAPEVAENVLVKLKALFGEKINVSLVCETWTKKYSQVVEVFFTDGSKDSILASDTVATERATRGGIKAMELVEGRHQKLISKVVSNTYHSVGKDISRAKLHKGFLPLPGGDALLAVNQFLRVLSVKYDIRLLASDYAYFANKEDKIVQTMRLEGNDKLQPTFDMKGPQEIYDYLYKTMKILPSNCVEIFKNNEAWANEFNDLKLEYEWRLAEIDGNPLLIAMDIIKKNGRMRWDDPKYVARLREELEVIARNPIKDLTAYFLPIRDVLNHYSKNGYLTGPGRGSAGGSLFVYLLGITHVNPFEYDLPFNRFFSLDRIVMRELPDIDVDLESRVPLVGKDGKSGYLYETYGDKAAQISTRTTIRLKSAITDANRYLKGEVEEIVKTFTKGLPPPPQGVSDANFVFGYEDPAEGHIPGLIDTSEELKKFTVSHPGEWEIVCKAMGITKAFSRHASAFIISDVPIKDVVPTKNDTIIQYEAKDAESAGLIKYDFLVINALKDLRVAMDLIKKKNNTVDSVEYFPHNGERTFIWDLPKDKSVFESTWQGATETCFQINTRSMIPHLKEMLPNNIMDVATLLALVRPGPLDFVNPDTGRNMVEEYMLLRKGEAEPDIKELADLLPETWGVITFQEQLSKIARDLCGFDGPTAETLRKHMAKKNMEKLMDMKPQFTEGAQKKVSLDIATQIWERMVTFGRYGFSVVHACMPENQEVMTSNGNMSIRQAFDSGVNIAYYDDGLIKFEKPTRWFDQGEKEVLSIELEDGSAVECTEDHKFLDADGSWRTAKEIIERGFFTRKCYEPLKIKSVKSLGVKPVYDIEMPSKHNFILANGVVAHNCEYAHITYATMFMKHHYPLEWWAAVLSNAKEQEISGKFWPFIRDMVAAPDINLSSDQMVVDYANEKIRAKFGVIRGLGDKSIDPIVEGRPYKNIQDFVDKGVAGPSLSCKLIHVGVLDSLFPPKLTLAQKLKMWADAVEVNSFNLKLKTAAESGKKMRSTQPKEGKVPEEYLNLSPMVDAAMKKAVLPSFHLSTFDLGRRYSKVLERWNDIPAVRSTTGHVTQLVTGEVLERLDQMPGESIEKDIYVAATCYIVKCEEFSYSKNTRRALKIIMDVDGYVSEKVLWPEYESGQLIYPKELKKGAIVTIFFRKRAGKKDISIQGCIVESEK